MAGAKRIIVSSLERSMARQEHAALVTCQLLVLGALASASGAAPRLSTSMLAGDDFFGQAQRSIQHDKKVLHRLEAHPLAHASGWDLSAAAGRGSGMSPALGGRKWQRKNDKLEKQLEDMSDSVNQMFSDQKNKKRYRRDEDRLFNQVRHVTGCVRAGRIRAPSNAVNARPEPL